MIFSDDRLFGLIKMRFERNGKIYIFLAAFISCLTPRYLACGFALVTCRAHVFLWRCFPISSWFKRLECFLKKRLCRKFHKIIKILYSRLSLKNAFCMISDNFLQSLKKRKIYKYLTFHSVPSTPRYLACGFALVTCRAYITSLEVLSD